MLGGTQASIVRGKEAKRFSKSEWTAAGKEKKRRKKVADGKQCATKEDADASYGPEKFWGAILSNSPPSHEWHEIYSMCVGYVYEYHIKLKL